MANDGELNLTRSDVVGLIQRSCSDVIAYCSAPADAVDGTLVAEHLLRTVALASRLSTPATHYAQPADAGEAETATRN